MSSFTSLFEHISTSFAYIKQPAENSMKYNEFCYNPDTGIVPQSQSRSSDAARQHSCSTQCLACIFFPCVGMLTKDELLISDSISQVQPNKLNMPSTNVQREHVYSVRHSDSSHFSNTIQLEAN